MNTFKKIIETYSNLYFPNINFKKETFDYNEDNEDNDNEIICEYKIIMTIISWLITGFAIYLSFRCSNGFSLGQFLLALFFTPFYIIYHLITTKLCGMIL